MKVDIIVASYNENIDWIHENNLQNQAIIYNKNANRILIDHGYKSIIQLENVGRESHTYLYHIINNYSNLADLNFFIQGHPHDHVPDIVNILQNPVNDNNIILGNDHTECFNFHCNRHPHITYITKKICTDLFIYHDGYNKYNPGACLKVTKQQILCRPLDFYKQCIKYLSREVCPIAGFSFERMWATTIFNPQLISVFDQLSVSN